MDNNDYLTYNHMPKRLTETPAASPVPPKKKTLATPPKFDLGSWEDEILSRVFKVTWNVSV